MVALLHIKESSGKTTKQVDIYALTENSTWTESNVTWNNVGFHSLTCYASTNLGNDAWAEFDLTKLAEAWKDGTEDEACGFLLKLADESTYRTFYSCEYSTVDYRPYVVLEYTEKLSLNYAAKSIIEGSSFTLTAATQFDTADNPSWKSSNESIATVSENGVVTGVKAGKAIITASCTDADGDPISATCTVYVALEDGVYYFQNFFNGKYLAVEDAGITGLVNVQQQLKVASGGTEWLCQLWKVKYLGVGRYTIRPMHKLDKALDVTNNNVDIYTIGTSDSLTVAACAQWYIEWNLQGYVFRNYTSDDCALRPENASTLAEANIVVDSYSPALTSFKWVKQKLDDPPSGAYIYDVLKECSVPSSEIICRFLIYGNTTSLSDMGILPVLYSATSNNQSFSWTSSNNAIAAINSSTGTITGLSSGTTTIIGQPNVDDADCTLSFNLTIIGKEQYDAGIRIATINGQQYYDYSIPVNNLFYEAKKLCEENRCKSWTQYCSWMSQWPSLTPSITDHKSSQLSSFLWFYRQVRSGAVWDIKLQARWEDALPGIPFPMDENGNFTEVVFRGEITTAEGLGNIMYGYTGRATGFGTTTLYWGGGVAAKNSASHPDVTTPPYYGDEVNDHFNIEKGYLMFEEDYPDYPEIGYDGIPLDGWIADIANAILGLDG